MLDAGEVGTEMLYYLVGSRDLDGGLMCTASHNPQRYTGAKLVKRGAIALSGDAGIGDIRAKIEDGLGDPPGGGHAEQVALYEEFQESGAQVHRSRRGQADAGGGGRRQRHGRSDGRPAAAPTRARPGRDLLRARRALPRPRAQPAAAREPRVHHARGRAPERPSWASPGTGTPTAASSSTTRARSSTATS